MDGADDAPPSHPPSVILGSLFRTAPVPLGVFLADNAKAAGPLALPTDQPELARLLSTCLVVPTPHARLPPPPMETGHSQFSQGEVVNRAIEVMLKSNIPNVLSLGYRQIRDQSAHSIPGAHGIETNYPNTLINQVKGPCWQTLLLRVGRNLMTWILTSLYIFVPLPNSCFFQLAGPPITELVRPLMPVHDAFATGTGASERHAHNFVGNKNDRDKIAGKRKRPDSPLGGPDAEDSEQPPKRPKKSRRWNKRQKAATVPVDPGVGPLREEGTTDRVPNADPRPPAAPQSRPPMAPPHAARVVTSDRQLFPPQSNANLESPAGMLFSRSRIFYARAVKGSKGNILFGLPKQHVLNRFNPKSTPKHLLRWALLRSIFPRQTRFADKSQPRPAPQHHHATTFHSLPFDNQPNQQTLSQRTVARMAGFKVPQRLKEFAEIAERATGRHRRCNYRAMASFYCWSLNERQGGSEGGAEEMDVDLPGVREPGAVELLRHHTPYRQVAAYCNAAVDKVFPKPVWGSVQNRRVVGKFIDRMVQLRRFETMNLHDLLHGFEILSVIWAAPKNPQQRIQLTDIKKRKEILSEFLWWFGESFLIPLIRSTFYVTESAPAKNRVFYYRHDIWRKMSDPLVQKLGHSNFQEIDLLEAGRVIMNRPFGFSFVRLLPKEAGARPIMNLKRKFSKEEIVNALMPKKPSQKAFLYPGGPPSTRLPNVSSINGALSNSFHVMTYEKNLQTSAFGASVLGTNDIYWRLNAARAKLVNSSEKRGMWPHLYFAKVDVKAAFDTLTQAKLVEVLKRLVSQDEYVIQRYTMVHASAGRIKRTFVKKADPDYKQFSEMAAELSSTLKNAIFVDQVVYPVESNEDIIRIVEEHVRNNIVKMGKKFYRQVVGIPQGSVLSSLMCSLFYGDMERNMLAFTNADDSVLLRLIDDFLFITTNREKAEDFLCVMYKGHPEYGCFVNKPKTLVNFDIELEGQKVSTVEAWHRDLEGDCNERQFPWCGLLIDMETLAVAADYTRYAHTYVRESITVDVLRGTGQNLPHKLVQSLKSKLHPLYLDFSLNGRTGVFLNLYHNFLLCAIKLHVILKEMSSVNHKYVIHSIETTMQYAYAILKSRTTSAFALESGCKCNVREAHFMWLWFRAFSEILGWKRAQYFTVLKFLQCKLAEPKFRVVEKQLGSIVTGDLHQVFRRILF